MREAISAVERVSNEFDALSGDDGVAARTGLQGECLNMLQASKRFSGIALETLRGKCLRRALRLSKAMADFAYAMNKEDKA